MLWSATTSNMIYCRRILSFAGYQNAKSNVYALNLLPAEAEWGVDRPFDEKSSLLCKPGTNLPYVLWVVGQVSRLWFFTAKGESVEHASIHVVPLADGAAQKARKLICNLSKPAIGMHSSFFGCETDVGRLLSTASTEDGWGDLRATKWLTERVRGQGERSYVVKPRRLRARSFASYTGEDLLRGL
jgi:hypothetical protein